MVSQLGLAPKYLTDFMHKPLSATSARPLRSTDRFDLFVPSVRSALTQCRAFAVTGPSTWSGLPPLLRAKLTAEPPILSSSQGVSFSPGFLGENASVIVYILLQAFYKLLDKQCFSRQK